MGSANLLGQIMKMIADREFSYRGVRVRVGEELDVEEGHVSTFQKIGHAHVEVEKEMGYQTRMMSAVDVVKRRGRPRKNQ
jgi:hypothetical protein